MSILLRFKIWWWARTVLKYHRAFYMFCRYNRDDEIYAEICKDAAVTLGRGFVTNVQGPMTLDEALQVYENIQPSIKRQNELMWIHKGSKS